MSLFRMFVTVSVAALLGACMSSSPSRDYNPPPRDYEAPAEYDAPNAPMSLHDRVHKALMDGMGAAASDISVRVDGGTVYLTGHVGSKADHDRAHDIAHNISGVTSVNHSGVMIH